jgi:APA family basic amino acid/polyamine antiporter
VREELKAGAPSPSRRIGGPTAVALVVASMIGTGVFITTGKVAVALPSAPAILACWGLAGIAALCGALAYAELGAALAASGGEYQFLSRLFHPALGFLAAWVSLIAGFSASLALVAVAFGEHLAVFVPWLDPRLSGALLIVLTSALNVWRVRAGAVFHNAFTVGRVLLIVVFIALGLMAGDSSRLFAPGEVPLAPALVSPGFAVSFVAISFSYAGWAAAAYVAGEITDPGRVLPRALVTGTLLVTLLYMLLNAVFLAAAPLAALRDRSDVGHVAATHLFGERGGLLVTAIIAIGLISTVSAAVVTGPRVYEAVGRDYPKLRFLAARRADGGPVTATALQAGLAVVMLLSASFDSLLVYIGFTLSLFSALAVAGVFALRRRKDIVLPFRMPGYPLTPILFIALMLWMTGQALYERPGDTVAGLATMAVGLVVYRLCR